MSLDLTERVLDYMMKAADIPEGVSLGRLDESGPGLQYVATANQSVKRYYNGRSRRTYAFEIAAKMETPQAAIAVLDDINRVMSDARPFQIRSENGSFKFVTAKMSATPAYKGVLEDDGVTYSVYSAAFQVEITY